jgi:hypothetical protein
MKRTSIWIVEPNRIDNLSERVDFDENDAHEWARYAIKQSAWQVACEIGPSSQKPVWTGLFRTEVAMVIASPDGRAAVWYGVTLGGATQPHAAREVTYVEAAFAATRSEAASRFFDSKTTRGGDRDVSPLALAACRVLHAKAFAYEPAQRDLLLAEFAVLMGPRRPDTTHLVRADNTTLEAASALVTINQYAAARRLLAGKGVHAP